MAEAAGASAKDVCGAQPELDEKAWRLVLGAVALAAGDGGVMAVAKLSGAPDLGVTKWL